MQNFQINIEDENQLNKRIYSERNIKTEENHKEKLPKYYTISTEENNSSQINNNKSNILSSSSQIQTLPNPSYDIKSLNSYITNIPKHSSAQIKSVPTFFFNTQLKVPDLRKFHTNIMENSERSYVIKKLQEEIEDRENFLNEIKKEEEEKKKNIKKEKKDEFNGNLNDYLKKRNEELIFMKEYPQKWPSQEAKDLVKEELKKVKSKYNLENNLKKNNNQKRLVLQKLEKYRFISYQNPLLQLNQPGTVPYLVNNGEMLYKLFEEGNNECNKRYNFHEQ